MSVVALGLRYQARAIAPPNWCGTPSRVEHLVERDDPGDQTAELSFAAVVIGPGSPVRPPGPPVGPQAGQRWEPQRLGQAGGP